MTVKEKVPSWFYDLIEKQDVSKEVLLHFQKHYFMSQKLEEKNEEL